MKLRRKRLSSEPACEEDAKTDPDEAAALVRHRIQACIKSQGGQRRKGSLSKEQQGLINKISGEFKGAVSKNNPIDIARSGSVQAWSIPFLTNSFPFRLGGSVERFGDNSIYDTPLSQTHKNPVQFFPNYKQ